MTKHVVIIETDMPTDVLHEALCMAAHKGTALEFNAYTTKDIKIIGQFNICPEAGALTK